MNTKLSQDAHDTLMAYEIRQQFVALEKARWALAQPKPCTSTWAPVMSEQEKKQHDQYVIDHKLPF